jgi:phenylpropionate dioxygenase-like ring-hydroxylating dioxygenase large terminal subunit
MSPPPVNGLPDPPEPAASPDPARRADPNPLLAPFSKGRLSVVRPLTEWYIVAQQDEVSRAPLATTLFGMPFVLFRDDRNAVRALLDRCPHRNVPLSLGKVVQGKLECAYHGWQFDGTGRCRFIPSLVTAAQDLDVRARQAVTFPVRVQDGFVWVYPTAGAEPTHEPYRFRLAGEPGYRTVRRTVSAPATLHATLENALDVPHTPFVHHGLFRNDSRGLTITARVRRTADRVEAEYIGEPRPTGLVGRLLSPSGGVVTHFDRFILPSIAEVEYRVGDENHILVMAAMTPVEDFFTRIHAVVAYRTRLPAAVLEPVLLPLALRIFAQDARLLRAQSENLRRFGGEQYCSTEIDVLGQHIWRLLRAAERGLVSRTEAVLEEHTTDLVV